MSGGTAAVDPADVADRTAYVITETEAVNGGHWFYISFIKIKRLDMA